ncbi:hypothetical protein MASR2M29_09110 [Spirochaetota bacterium]
MKSLLVHYHLKPGGVSSVIKRQMSALAGQGVEACALVGELGQDFGACVSVEPALAYDKVGEQADSPNPDKVKAIVRSIEREAAFLGENSIIHVHNPSIRKNSSLLAALAILSEKGLPLVLQIHDLAEDWRPDVYSAQAYPEKAHWVLINRRDEAMLKAAGADYASFLPNSVPLPKEKIPAKPKKGPGLILYPVRGLRRKNIGEAVLLSFFMRKGSRIGLTLPPNSPRDLQIYDEWKKAAAGYRAAVSFGLGLKHSLDELYEEAITAISTSVKEGFGLSFLEPIARGKSMLGRRISYVVNDFEAMGVKFPQLYSKLSVPLHLFDYEAFMQRVEKAMEAACLSFGAGTASCVFPGCTSVKEFCELVSRVITDGTSADFGRLDETAQREVLSAIYEQNGSAGSAGKSIIGLNPFIENWDEAAGNLELADTDSLLPWEEASYGQSLVSIYKAVLDGRLGRAPDKAKLLQKYLVPEAFYGIGI